MTNRLPVKIKNISYNTLGPIQNYIHPKTIVEYRTVCTIILDRGIPDNPVKEHLTGQTKQDIVQGVYVETATYNQAKSENLAYNAALNKIDQYGFVLKDASQNLGY